MGETLSAETVTWFIVSVNAALAGLLVLLLAAILADTAGFQGVRRWRLARELSRIRLGGMAARWGLDGGGYVRAVPVPELRGQLAACRRCQHGGLCDEFIVSAAAAEESLAFCPNAPALRNFVRGVASGPVTS